MAALCKQLKDENENRAKFRAAYRDFFVSRHRPKPKANEADESPIDYSELWDVGEITPVEI